MNIISFNTNSIRMRLHQLQSIIDRLDPDVIGIQESKVSDEDFPFDDIAELGYHAEVHGQKTHYGVALLSKTKPEQVFKGLPDEAGDAQRRLIGAEYQDPKLGKVTVINGYFPQGENRNHPTKFPNKVAFYEGLQRLLETRFAPTENILVIGDMNIASVDEDIGIGADNQKRWLREGKTSFLPEERAWLQKLYDWGLTDTYRHLHPASMIDSVGLTTAARASNGNPAAGFASTLILASQPMLEQLTKADIDYEARAMVKPSDHCPIWAAFKG